MMNLDTKIESVGDTAMSKRIFSTEDRKKLMHNKNVIRVGETGITYSPDFKVKAVRANLRDDKTPNEIFINAGFDLNVIGHKNPKRCLRRWRAIMDQRGEEGLRNDQRGKHFTGRSVERELTIEERLRRAEAKIKYLQQENELLKKFDKLERSVVDRPSKKYEVIQELVVTKESGFNVAYLCEIAGVSRSGYYRWLNYAPKRAEKEKNDYEQHLVIKEIFLQKRRKAGWRTIRMNLERQGIIMNHKKIRRLMKKYDLITQVRRRNPYRQIARATQQHRTLPNVLNRNFTQSTPYKAFGTDITYLYDGNNQRFYLSVLRDIASGEIIAHHVSTSLGMKLSISIVRQVVQKLGARTLNGALIHSDQGFHYTHPLYIRALAKLGVVQSMSRKGNCLDNAPVESFFGHMKDELDLSSCYSVKQVKAAVDKYIHDYNHHRYQWTRRKMAPIEYRNHLISA
jgi:putative transposase